MKPGERLAVADLGSNSFRLVVFMAGASWWKRTDEIYEPVRIGQGLAASGELGARPMERALYTLDVFAQFCRASGLQDGAIDALATSAIRDAANADAFLSRARARSQLPIRVLSREAEARYGYLAAVNSTTLHDGYVMDLGGGSLQVVSVLRGGGFDGLETTEAGLREGVFFERLLAGREPPLFEDVRRSSVLNLAAQYRVDPPHTRHVAALALGLFDELAALELHAGDARERELLWAACMLHDIGMSIDYDDHHKHSRYLILNAGLPGFSPVEVAIIAQSARYHRKGLPVPGPLAALFGEGDAQRLDRCAVLLRLAEDLERSRDQLVRGTALARRDGVIELRLIADGEAVVPRWAASREAELFSRAFGLGLAVAG